MRVNEYIDGFCQLPSITGKDVIELEEYAKLPRTQTYDKIKGFLEIARSVKEVRALFIVAEWGEGKTSIYEGLLKKSEIIKSDLVIPIPTKRLLTHVKEKAGTLFSDTGSFGIRFFACLLYTIKDVIENDLMNLPPFNKIKIKPKEKGLETPFFIKDGLASIFNSIPKESRVFLFIDEFEDIIDEPTEIRHFVIRGLLDVVDGYPRVLLQEPFAGRLHFLIAVTPPAYEEIRRMAYADWQRFFGQRVFDVNLEKLTRKDAYNYILGILKYCWRGRLPRIPFSEPGMFNAIYVATLGNPRSIVNLVETLLGHAKAQAPLGSGKIKIIDPEDFIKALSDMKIAVYGGEITLLSRNFLFALYDKLRKICKERGLKEDKCIDLLHLLLSNLSPISVKKLREKIGLVEEKDAIEDYLNALAESLSELWGIDRPFVLFKRITDEGRDVIYSKLGAPETPQNLSKVVNALEFYHFDQNCSSLQGVLFVPHRRLSELSLRDSPSCQNYIDFFTSFSPELNTDEIRILVDTLIFDQVGKGDEDYLMLSPRVISIFYPSPSMFFLDFIEDLNKRFEIGSELMRNLTSFEREFREGIINLLRDGCKNVGLERHFEQYSYGKEIEVMTLSYKEATQEYHLRAYILSLLKISEEDLREKIEVAISEMKVAHIPLLIIFSWNPLPTEIKARIETLLGPYTPAMAPEKVFYYLEYPLTFMQCQQICAYVRARENGYKVKEERWKARASRILEEIKFEERLEEFIREGLSAGYVVKPLEPKRLSLSDVPKLLRTLLITNGSISERYKQVQEMEEKFRIYGKDFSICPLDIESEEHFKALVDELKDLGLIKVSEGILDLELTPVERRILSVLKEYGGKVKEDIINKLFISTKSQGPSPTLYVYLNMLIERREIKKDGDYFRVIDLKELDHEFEKLKEEVIGYEKRYADSQYGYLLSMKKRKINVIILKDCVRDLLDIVKALDKHRLTLEPERRVRRQILLELLTIQLRELISLVDEFYREYQKKVKKLKEEVRSLKKSLEKFEESLNNLRLTGKVLKIKERLLIDEEERRVQELESKTYDREEMIEWAKSLLDPRERIMKVEEFDFLYRKFKGCLVFDIKMVQAMNEYERLKRVIEGVKQTLDSIQRLISDFVELRESLREHEVLSLSCENKLSSLIQGWIKQSVKLDIG